MRLEHFSAQGVHGYLRFDVRFNSDITMLHGINGAGKTTAVRAIMALLTPDLNWLSSTQYEFISLTLSFNDNTHIVSSTKSNDQIHISVQSNVGNRPEIFTFSTTNRLIEYLSDRNRNSRRHGYAIPVEEEIERNFPPETDLSAIRAIRELPVPTFLGLERTTLPPDISQEDPATLERRRLGTYSRLSLDASISEALRLAKDAYDQHYRKPQAELMSRLRSKIILSLFRKSKGINRIELPQGKDSDKYVEMQRRITNVLRQIQLVSDADIRKEVDPFFNELISLSQSVMYAVQDRNMKDEKRTELIMKWVELESPLRAIEEVVKLTQDYEKNDARNFLPFRQYQDVLVGFLTDSGKSIKFDESGNIDVTLPNGRKGDVGQFSSGEKQLFVLITHLAFNNKTKEANILIIDEPELSLHLKWQQRLVDSILAVSPSTQVVLATHSPSIIGKYRHKCVSLNAKK